MTHRPTLYPLLAYGALALIILGPALAPGYILTLDMIFTPVMHLPLGFQNLVVFNALINALNLIVPAWILQKLILIAIFTTAGLGLHRLVPADSPWARYAAGFFYVANPFTYERLMAGQYLVLAGYALLPWFLAALLRWLGRPTSRRALPVAGWLAAVGFVSLHAFGFAAGLLATAGLFAAARAIKHPADLRPLALSAVLIAGLTTLAASPWLVPLLAHRSPEAQLIAGFDTRHFLSFRTEPDPHLGLPGGALTLSGFWEERDHEFLLPKSPYWLFIAVPLAALMIAGAVVSWRRSRTATAFILTTLIVAWILAQGIMDNPFALLNNWLFEHLPLYRGYREPGKFIALIALAEAYFLGVGVSAFLAFLHHRRQSLVPTAAILLLSLPWLYTPTIIWAAAGQLHATDYPPDWYALSRTLAAQHTQSKVLVLPWHQYMYFDFANRLIANPAQQFFGPRIIQGDNAEIGLIDRQSTNPTSTFIEQRILAPTTGRTDLAVRLATIGVEYVVLLKTADADQYSWLDHQPGLILVSDTATLRLYQRK